MQSNGSSNRKIEDFEPVKEGRSRSTYIPTADIAQLIAVNEPFRGHLSTANLKDGIYSIYFRKRLVYRLNTLTGAYSIETDTYNTGEQLLLKMIRKGKDIYGTPLEEAIAKDTRQI